MRWHLLFIKLKIDSLNVYTIETFVNLSVFLTFERPIHSILISISSNSYL